MDTNAIDTSISATNNTTTAETTAERTPRYRAAFTRLLPQIRALPKEKYMTVNLDIPSCIQTTEGVVPKIAAMRSLIADQLPQFSLQLFDELEDRALALGHAHTLYERSKQPPPELQGLAEEGKVVHDVALSELTTQVRRGLIPTSALSTLSGGNGYENLVADLFKLADALKSNWDKIAGRTTMTMSELDHMENIADDLRKALGVREQMPELQASSAVDRQAAYALYIESYDEVRSALGYVRRKENDLDELMPSLYAGRTGKKKVTPEVPANPPAAPSTPADNHNPAVVTPAPTPATNASAIANAPVNSGAAANAASPSVLEHGPFAR